MWLLLPVLIPVRTTRIPPCQTQLVRASVSGPMCNTEGRRRGAAVVGMIP